MKAPAMARIVGLLWLFAGALALVPLVTPPAPMTAEYLTLGANYGWLFGIFAVNAPADLLHIVLGGWGLIGSFGFKGSVLYLRAIAWICLILALLGAIPITNTLFGALPVYGYDIALHVVVGVFALYGGYGAGSIPPPVEAAP